MQEARGLGRPAGPREGLHLGRKRRGVAEADGRLRLEAAPPPPPTLAHQPLTPHALTLKARLPLAKAPVGSPVGWP